MANFPTSTIVKNVLKLVGVGVLVFDVAAGLQIKDAVAVKVIRNAQKKIRPFGLLNAIQI